LGDSLFVNPMILGFAWPKGWVPLSYEALMRAIELNDMAVAQNKTAFEWGRHCAHDWAAVQAVLAPAQVVQFHKPEGLNEVIARRAKYLTDYQNAAYANRYLAYVDKVRAADAAAGKTALTEAVARNLFKLMAYKDEYEVARLHTDKKFLQNIDKLFEGNYTVNYHLAPPLIAKTNAKGELQKQKFGPHMLMGFKLLKQFKGLRGTALDVFGYTEERRMERALIQEYQASIDKVLAQLQAGHVSAERYALALELARLPESMKGFGHVKARNVDAARRKWADLEARWNQPAV